MSVHLTVYHGGNIFVRLWDWLLSEFGSLCNSPMKMILISKRQKGIKSLENKIKKKKEKGKKHGHNLISFSKLDISSGKESTKQ